MLDLRHKRVGFETNLVFGLQFIGWRGSWAPILIVLALLKRGTREWASSAYHQSRPHKPPFLQEYQEDKIFHHQMLAGCWLYFGSGCASPVRSLLCGHAVYAGIAVVLFRWSFGVR